MSRSGSKRVGIAPTLFPFLAVMLCTIGALVLILILSVSSAQSTVQEMVDQAEQQAELEEATIQLVSNGLSEKLDEGRIVIEKKRLELQHLEEHIRELIEELDKLQNPSQPDETASDTGKRAHQPRSELIASLERQLAEAKEQLRKKADDPDKGKPIFAIIPYDGPNGTHRRPIYLECDARGVVIQPDGITLTPQDLQPPYGPGNPLDAALRTIRAEFPSKTGSVTSNPYPLLIVRPSGIKYYMMARAAMTGWDDQFGYELISEDMPLAYPDSVPQLAEKITQSLDLARQRQAALVRAMPQYYDQQGWDEHSSVYDSPENSTLGRSGESSNGLSGAPGHGADAQPWDSGLPTSGSASGQSAGGSGFNTVSVPVGTSMSGLSPARAGGSGGTGIGAGSSFAPDPFGSGSPSSSAFADSGSSRNESESSHDLLDSRDASNGTSGMRSSTSRGSGVHGGSGSEDGSLESAENSQPTSGSTTGNQQFAGNSSSNSGAAYTGAANNAVSQGSTSFAASGSSGGDPSTASSWDQANQDFSQVDPSDPNQSGSTPPSLSMNFSNQKSESTRPVAASRGSNWAWERSQREQTAVVRPIRLQCYTDRWILLPEKGSNDKMAVIELVGRPIERAGRLAIAIRHRVEGWGVAINGGHWIPMLQVDVAPNAEWRYQQLCHLMEGSGIDVKRHKTIGE